MASTLQAFVRFYRRIGFSLLVLTCLWQGILVHGESEIITEDNLDMIFEGEWMIKFYAPWCPACRNLRPIWDKFAVKAETLNVRVGEVDVTTNTALSGRFGIVSLPTVYHAINGEFRLYQEKRKFDELVSFVKEQKWEDVEAIPSWKSPGSILMRGLGVVFKISVLFRDTHTLLTDTYGLPAWGSYVIFGVGTVLIGLILGMVLVFVTDHLIGIIWPAPAYKAPPGDEQNVPESDVHDETKEATEEEKDTNEAVEQNSGESTNVRKRGKKLKATME